MNPEHEPYALTRRNLIRAAGAGAGLAIVGGAAETAAWAGTQPGGVNPDSVKPPTNYPHKTNGPPPPTVYRVTRAASPIGLEATSDTNYLVDGNFRHWLLGSDITVPPKSVAALGHAFCGRWVGNCHSYPTDQQFATAEKNATSGVDIAIHNLKVQYVKNDPTKDTPAFYIRQYVHRSPNQGTAGVMQFSGKQFTASVDVQVTQGKTHVGFYIYACYKDGLRIFKEYIVNDNFNAGQFVTPADKKQRYSVTFDVPELFGSDWIPDVALYPAPNVQSLVVALVFQGQDPNTVTTAHVDNFTLTDGAIGYSSLKQTDQSERDKLDKYFEPTTTQLRTSALTRSSDGQRKYIEPIFKKTKWRPHQIDRLISAHFQFWDKAGKPYTAITENDVVIDAVLTGKFRLSFPDPNDQVGSMAFSWYYADFDMYRWRYLSPDGKSVHLGPVSPP